MLRRTIAAVTLTLCTGVGLASAVASSNPLEVVGVHDGVVFTPLVEVDPEFVRVTVPIAGVESALVLHPVSHRAASFQAWIEREAGVLEPFDAAPARTYQGRVVGVANSRVAASIIDGEVWAYVSLDGPLDGPIDSTVIGVQPVGKGLHVAYDATDRIPVDAFCGVDERHRVGRAPFAAGEHEQTSEMEICVPAGLTAFDTDFEFFQWAGGAQETIDQIELVMNAVDVIYQRDIPMGHLIGEMIIRATMNDPYSGDISNRLEQFRLHWNSQQQGIDRHLAHHFSGTGFDGPIGLAFVGVPCRAPNFAYGISISSFSNNFVSRVALTAHELGHNWSAEHCDGAADCGIMCSFVGGCAQDEENFGADSQGSIRGYSNAVQACLDEECFDGEPPASGIAFGNTLSGEIGSIDATGRFVPVTIPDFDVDGMAYDRNRQTFLLSDTRDGATLYSMRDIDSRISVVGPFVGASRIAGLAFDPNNDRLYGIDQAIGQLYLIEPQFQGEDFVALATPIGSRNGGLMGGLAFDEDEGVLYGVDDFGGSTLYSIDTDTGEWTEIGDLGLQDCDGLCWRPEDQTLYTIDGRAQAIYTVDKETGDAEALTQFVGFGIGSTFGMAVGSEECLADIDGNGELDADDFFGYLDLFAAGDPSADLTGSGDPNDPSYGVPDGSIDGDDFFFFLDLFSLGCE